MLELGKDLTAKNAKIFAMDAKKAFSFAPVNITLSAFSAFFSLRSLRLIFFILLTSTPAFSQSPKQWLKHAEKSFAEKDYYGASVYYRNAFLADSSNTEVTFKYAESLRLSNDYKTAGIYYARVINKDKEGTFTEAIFWLAAMQKYQGNYQDAKSNFQKFTSRYKRKDTFIFKKAMQEIKSCEFAMSILSDTLKVKVSNMGENINTEHSEFALIPVRDSVIWFSSMRPGKINKDKSVARNEDYRIRIYSKDGSGATAVLDTLINSAGTHAANGCFSPDKKRFYFSRCGDDQRCDIFSSDIIDGKVQPAVKLNNINTEGYTSTQPSSALVEGKEVLLFVSDRPGGKGRLDIWYSVFDKNGFISPVNAGAQINTIDDEITPFYDSGNKILYFSSAWHYGLGGFDIFKSEGSLKNLQKPVNMGIPYNSSMNDMYFIPWREETGFFTSNRIGTIADECETCCNDVWQYELEKKVPEPVAPPSKYASLEELQKFLPVMLYFHNDEPGPRSRDTSVAQTYMESFRTYAEMRDEYKENYSKGLSGEKMEAARDSIDSFFDHYVDKGAKDLEHFTELLLDEMKKGRRLEMTVIGHASPLAKSDYNVNLTLRRISSLVNYLSEYENGIFLPYMGDSAENKGYLKIIRIPFGEYKAKEHISDVLHDKKNSVYGISASLHRNIEIASVTLAHADSSHADLVFQRRIHNFGHIRTDKIFSYTFHFKNKGKEPLQIYEAIIPDSSVSVEWSRELILPGAGGEVTISVDPKGAKGKKIKFVTIVSNAYPSRRELILTFER